MVAIYHRHDTSTAAIIALLGVPLPSYSITILTGLFNSVFHEGVQLFLVVYGVAVIRIGAAPLEQLLPQKIGKNFMNRPHTVHTPMPKV